MKISDYWDTYYAYSKDASTVARTAAFAGLGSIWIFRLDGAPPRIPDPLLLPLALFVVGLALDLLQYLVASLVWLIYATHLERTHDNDYEGNEHDHPRWVVWPIDAFFWLKLAFIAVGFICLVRYCWIAWQP